MVASAFVRPPWASPQQLYRHLVEAPATEPLTLDEAKLYAGFEHWASGDPREPLLQGFIAAARAKVEFDTGLALLTQTWDLYFEATVDGLLPLPAQATPLQSIEEVIALNAPGGPVNVTEFQPTPDRKGITLAAWPATWGPYVVQVVSGWETPALLMGEAPLLRHAVGLLTAHYATLGRDLASSDEPVPVPFGYDEIIQPYRLTWLP